MAEEIGVAFVRLIPSMRGFADEAGDAMNGVARGPSQQAGDAAGTAFGSRFGGAFKAGLAGLALGAGVALMAGITEALDQSRITGRLGAQLGATAADAERYGHIAGQLYSQAVVDDFQAGADTIRAIMGAGLVDADATNREIESVATGVADLANAFEFDLGETAAAVGQLISNDLAPDAESALDMVAAGLRGTDERAGDLLDTLTEYSPILTTVGLDAADSLGLFRQGLAAGINNTDKIADAVKEFSLRAVTDTEAIRTAFAALGLDGQQIGDDVAAGGDRARSALDAVLDSLREMPATTQRATAIQELFGGPGEDLGAGIFALDVDQAAESLGEMGNAAEGLGTSLRDNAGVRLEQFKRNLQQNFVEFLGGEVIPAAQDLREELAPALDAIGDAFAGVGTDAGTGMGGANSWLQRTMEQIRSTVSTGTTATRDTWNVWGSDLASNARSTWTQIQGQIGGSFDVIKGLFQIAGGLLTGDWGKTWEGIKNTLRGAWTFMTAQIRGSLSLAKNLVSAGMKLLGGLFSAAWGGIKAGASAAWRRVVDDTRAYLGRMKAGASDAIGDVVGFFRGLKDRVSRVLSGAGRWLVAAGRSIIQGLIDGLRERLGSLISTLSSIADTVRSYWPFSPAKEGPLRDHPMDEAGANIGSMLADGIRSSVRDVAAASSLAAGAAAIPAGAGAYSAGPGSTAAPVPVLRVEADGSRTSQLLMAIIQNSVRLDYGGSVTAALTPGR